MRWDAREGDPFKAEGIPFTLVLGSLRAPVPELLLPYFSILDLLFYLQDRHSMSLRNVGYDPPDYTTSYPKRQQATINLGNISIKFKIWCICLLLLNCLEIRKTCGRKKSWMQIGYSILSTTYVQNFSDCDKYLVSYIRDEPRKSSRSSCDVCSCCQTLTKFGYIHRFWENRQYYISRECFQPFSTFYMRTDIHDEANIKRQEGIW